MDNSPTKVRHIKLDRGNFLRWKAYVKDEIFSADHERAPDIWTAYEWDLGNHGPDDEDPALQDWTLSEQGALSRASASDKKLRTVHYKLWSYIRAHLTDNIFDLSEIFADKHGTNVPLLLRHLRQTTFMSNQVCDKHSKLVSFEEIKLESYEDMEKFLIAFEQLRKAVATFNTMYKSDDDMIVHRLTSALPEVWRTKVLDWRSTGDERTRTYEMLREWLILQAKYYSSLPGSMKSKPASTVHMTDDGKNEETCRQFARGRCRRGDNCKFSHPPRSGGDSQGSGDTNRPTRAFNGTCDWCGIRGHKEEDCRAKKFREQREQQQREQQQQQLQQREDSKQRQSDRMHATPDEEKHAQLSYTQEYHQPFVSIEGCYTTIELDRTQQRQELDRTHRRQEQDRTHQRQQQDRTHQRQQQESTHAKENTDKHAQLSYTQEHLQPFALIKECYATAEHDRDVVSTIVPAGTHTADNVNQATVAGPGDSRYLFMCLDGASNCAVLQSEAGCIDVRDADITIRTGGRGAPTLVQCRKVGVLPLRYAVDGRLKQLSVPVRIIPGFGVNLLPERYFLQQGHAINKTANEGVVLDQNERVVLRAFANKFDNSGLFYVRLDLTGPDATTTTDVISTHFTGHDEEEDIENGPSPPPDPPDSQARVANACNDASPFHHDIVHASTDRRLPIPELLTGLEGATWRAALDREVRQHLRHKTMRPLLKGELQPGDKAIPFDCLSKTRRDGSQKIRGIIKGFHLQEGLHYNDTFAPLPCVGALRFFLALAAKEDWEAVSADVNTAFLAPRIDTRIVISVPNWFRLGATGLERGSTLHLVLGAIPGVPQGPRLWSKEARSVFVHKLHLVQSRTEWCLYFDSDNSIYLLIWVDDIFAFFPTKSQQAWDKLYTQMRLHMDLDDYQDLRDMLGCAVVRDRSKRTLTVSQSKTVTKLLQAVHMADASPKPTPMAANLQLSKTQSPPPDEAAVRVEEQRVYRSTTASLIYIAGWTRIDISFAVGKLCKFMHNPGDEHEKALKHALRFLAGTKDAVLKYDFSGDCASDKLTGYYDASHADCPDTRRSTVAFVFFLGGAPLSWKSKLHTCVTTSTSHSEVAAAAMAAREAKWWHMFLDELGFKRFCNPIHLYSDSKGAIAMTYNPINKAASKHVDLADHYAREQQERGVITITHVSSRDMIADILTKPLGRELYRRHATKLVHYPDHA